MPGGNKKVTQSLQMNVHKYHILLDKIWFWCINNCNFANLNSYNDVIALATLFGLISFLLWSVTNYWSYFLLITPGRLRNTFYTHTANIFCLYQLNISHIPSISCYWRNWRHVRRHALAFWVWEFPCDAIIENTIRCRNFHYSSGIIVLFSVFSATSSTLL